MVFPTFQRHGQQTHGLIHVGSSGGVTATPPARQRQDGGCACQVEPGDRTLAVFGRDISPCVAQGMWQLRREDKSQLMI